MGEHPTRGTIATPVSGMEDLAALPTRERLVVAAARLFRLRGYNGVGLAEILAVSGVPKGSLYHHFPAGKADLGRAAADWAAKGMVAIIDDAFRDATTWEAGFTTLCHKLAKFFDISEHRDGCPVSAILFEAPENDALREQACAIFGDWIEALAAHDIRLGADPDLARERAEQALIAVQGSWVLARARRSSDVLRAVPRRMLGGTG